jgi:hypothetical protein
MRTFAWTLALMGAAAAELKIFLLAGQSNMEGVRFLARDPAHVLHKPPHTFTHSHTPSNAQPKQAEVATKNKTTGEYLNGTLAYQ